LIELNWTEEVSTHAIRTIHERKKNKPKLLPLTEDIMKLSKMLKEEGRKCASILLRSLTGDRIESWRNLNEITLSHIVMFNRKRTGEVSKLKVEEFTSRPKPDGQKLLNSKLSKIEQELCRSLQRIEITGKRGNTVPVLLTEEMRGWLEVLIRGRTEAGVTTENQYLFPCSSYGGKGHIRGCDALRKWSKLCGASHPECLRSTKLRKQIATVSQIVNLKENELDILAKFMGHDIRVHREYYRLPEETMQVAKVSKLLIASEKGMDIAGMNLDDINVSLDDGELCLV
jgi:integrase